MNRERLLERFLQYVCIESTSDEETSDYPSSSGQLEMGRLLVTQLEQIGLADIEQDPYGLIWATLPANCDHAAPTITLNAHLDTSPETPAVDVKPQIIEDYQGGDIVLSGAADKVIRVAECPELEEMIGRTLITTDGTTLLGGDDKAGIAIIMEAVSHLAENPQILHGPVRVLFTCDEEIGRGVQHVDIDKLGSVAAYTLDGGGAGDIDVETFSADLATVTVRGVNLHPSIAKDRMVNALRAAGSLLDQLPRDTLAPEVSDGRDGFLHPYSIEGGVAEVTIKIILRDFDTEKLAAQAELIRLAAQSVQESFPGSELDLTVRKQYRNMADGLDSEPRAVELARQAHQNLGFPVKLSSVRGGTDGSQLTELGLPTPNLSSGQHTPHSPLEWACLDEMLEACQVVVETLRLWGEQQLAD